MSKRETRWCAGDEHGWFGDAYPSKAKAIAAIRKDHRLVGLSRYRFLWRMELVREIEPTKKGQTK